MTHKFTDQWHMLYFDDGAGNDDIALELSSKLQNHVETIANDPDLKEHMDKSIKDASALFTQFIDTAIKNSKSDHDLAGVLKGVLIHFAWIYERVGAPVPIEIITNLALKEISRSFRKVFNENPPVPAWFAWSVATGFPFTN